MNYKDFFWILPFMSFAGGYYLVSSFSLQSTVTTPALVGLTLVDAIDILSAVQLNPRILAKKEDPDLPEGLIISQTPAAHQQIKIGQPVYIVITKKSDTQPTPSLINSSKKTMIRTVRDKKIHEKVYDVPYAKSSGLCIGQSPSVGRPCVDNAILLYYPSAQETSYLVPDFLKKTVDTAKNFLQNHDIHPTIEHIQPKQANHSCTHCRVVKQKPIAHSTFDISKKPPFTLWVN
ncbi:MAG: PASTA domain-containing protein [Candidatus Babeliales bacterium]